MSSQPASDWKDLSRLWQAEGAAVSLDELERYVKRERRSMRALATAELAGLGLGVLVGVWLSLWSPYFWLAGVFIAFCVVMGWVALRRTDAEPQGGDDLLTSLRISMAREDWVASQLRFGRALSFVVLFVIVFLGSHMMRNFAAVHSGSFLALGVAAAWVCAVLAWNLSLVRRSARRRQRLESYASRLEARS
jgi:MFS family permease